MSTLSWRHHTLIQALLSRGPLKEDEFHSIFSDVTGKDAGAHRKLFNDYLLKINNELAFVQFELRACRNQYDGCIYYGVVNSVLDDQSKLGTKYSVPQIAFYKGIIEAIVQDSTAHGIISNIDALNICLENQFGLDTQVMAGGGSQSQGVSANIPQALKNFTMSRKENTLGELVKDQWLCTFPDEKIGLGVRSFLDMRSWFCSSEVPRCEFCNEAGIMAELCQNRGCNVRLHKYCQKQKFSNRRVERVCPGCGTEWNYLMPKGEAVEDDLNGFLQSQDNLRTSRRKRPRTSETAEDIESGSSQLSRSVSRSTRSSSRLRGTS